MKAKNLFILIAILAALAAGIVIRQSQKPAELAVEEYAPLDLSFDEEKVQKIVIEKVKDGKLADASRIEMAREDGIWKLRSFANAKTNEQKVTDFLKAISQARGELRGSGKKIFEDFGITDSESYQIALSSERGQALLELVLGMKTAGEGFVFLRKKNSEAVYLAETGLFSKMGINGQPEYAYLSKEFWAAKDFLSVDESKARTIKISKFEQGKEIISAEVTGSARAWKFKREGMPFPASDEKVTKFLAGLKTWQAEKLLTSGEKDYGFSSPSWQMKIGMEDGTEKTFKAGTKDKETGAVYMQVAGNPVVFQLSKQYFENLDINDTSFIASNPLGVEPDTTEKMVVRSGKERFEINPAQKKWDTLTGYINDLKNLRFNRVLTDGKNFKPGPQSLEVTVKGKPPVTLEVGGFIAETKEYPVMVRGSQTALALPEQVYKWLFLNLYRLKEPEIPLKKTPQ